MYLNFFSVHTFCPINVFVFSFHVYGLFMECKHEPFLVFTPPQSYLKGEKVLEQEMITEFGALKS